MYHIIIVFLLYFFNIFFQIDAHPKVRTRAVRVYWDIYGMLQIFVVAVTTSVDIDIFTYVTDICGCCDYIC